MLGYFEYKCRRCGQVFLGASLQIDESVSTGAAARMSSAVEGEAARLMSDLVIKGVARHPNGKEFAILDSHFCDENCSGVLGVGDLIGFGHNTAKE